jgi:uncharacterized repeat protein (TIGR02543 family)
MGLFFKKSNTNTSSDWVTAKSVWVKNENGVWTVVKKIFVKALSGWVQFWPKSGPVTTTPPYFSTDTAGNTQPSNSSTFTLPVNTTCYLQKGTWGGNGGTISSYSYQIAISNNSTIGTTKTNTYDSGSMINYASISLTNTTYDGQYIIGTVTATRTDSVTGVDSTDSNNFRYFVMRASAPQNTSATTDRLIGVFNPGDTITYTGLWNGDANHLPDSTRSKVSWYKSSTSGYTTASQVIAGSTLISTVYTTPSNSGGTYTVTATYTTNATTDLNYYFYAVNTEQNSNTDYNGNPTTAVAATSLLVPPPVVQTAPTITATSPSGYVYDSSNPKSNTSAMPGSTIVFNTGTWSPAPNGTYAVSWIPYWGSSSNATSDTNNLYLLIGSTPTRIGGFDTTQNQNHSITLTSLISSTNVSPTYNSPGGYYLTLNVLTKNGNAISLPYNVSPILMQNVPIAPGAPVLTYTSDNNATVYWSFSTSWSYEVLQYSTDGGVTWNKLGSNVTTQPTSTVPISYSGLPSGSASYRVVAYNPDGVGAASSTTTYNSTPSPDTPTFTYDYGGQGLYYGTITATANKSTSISATVYRSGSSSWGTTITYDTAYSSGTNNLYYSIPTSGYYYLYVTATNSHGSASAYSIINNSTIFYAGIPIGTAYQSVSASTTTLEIDLSWTPANWQTYSPYTGDNVTYRNNNASYEVYRSTSSSTPANSVTPTYTGLTGSSYADTSSLSSSTTYYYWIRGRNTETYSGWQSMGNATTYTPPNPQPFTTISGTKAYPTGATQSASEPTQNRTLTTSWNASTNATYYEVQYEGSNDNSTWTVLQSLAGAPYLTTTSNTYAAAYYRYYRYTVRARDAAKTLSTAAYSDYGSSGSLVYYYITGSNPSTPSINSVTPGTGSSYSSALVNYSFPSNPGSNTIDWNYWSLDNATWNQVYATSFTIFGLSASTGYYVYMRSMNYDMLYSGSTYQYFATNAAPVYYTVTWGANGGTVSPASSTQSTVGGSVTAPTPTLSGYSFNGWYNAASGGSLIVSGGGSYTPSSNVTLYAQWTYIHVYPTISSTLGVASITTTSAVISWSQTNASYDYLNGATYLGLATSTTLTGLSPSTAYSGYVTVYSTTGDTATGYYSFTTAAAGVKPSAPTGLYGSNDYSPHGGHFYFTASATGTAPITYYFTVTRSTTLTGTYSAYTSNSTAGNSILVQATGYFKCSVYASNAYGSSSTVSTSTGVQFT